MTCNGQRRFCALESQRPGKTRLPKTDKLIQLQPIIRTLFMMSKYDY